MVLILAAVLAAFPAAQAPAYAATTPQAVVSADALNVRSGPGTTFAVIDVVHSGDELPITGQSGTGWLRVTLSSGSTGWINGTYVVVSGDLSNAPVLAIDTSVATKSGTVGATAGTPSGATGSHVIVFQVSSGGPIYAVNPDGTGLRYLTTGIDPALSPDGQWVAFTRWQGQSNGVQGSLWVINIDGSGERQVTAGANQAKSPTWSPDGTQIAISLQQGGTVNDTYLCFAGPGQAPKESPQPIDGMRCMPQKANPFWGLRVVNVATGAYEDLPRESHSFAPTWNPANAWQVVFRGDRGLESLDLNQKTLWTISANGAYRGPVFSPDGSKLAVTYKQNDHWEVHVLNPDGSNEVRLTETPLTVIVDQQLAGQTARQWNNAAPAWSPDGSQIAFVSDRNGPYELWVMNADGSNPHLLVPASALGGQSIQYDGNDERVISWR